METRRYNETFKLKLIHKHWFIEAGGKLHRLSFLKGARSVQIEDNVISADGCMYQVQLNYRKEVKIEKIDDICIYDEPSNEQLSHNKEKFDSSIKAGIYHEKDEFDASEQYGQGSDECFSLKYKYDVVKQYGMGSKEYVSLACSDKTDSASSGQHSDFVKEGKEDTESASFAGQQDSAEKETEDKTYLLQEGTKLNHVEQDRSNQMTRPMSKKGEETKGLSCFLSRLFTNKRQPSESRQSFKQSKVQIILMRETANKTYLTNAIKDLFKGITSEYILCAGIENLSDTSPLVVVCSRSFRLKPDIDYAIKGINWKKTFVVLLMYSETWALQGYITSPIETLEEEYKNIVFIDIVYTIGAKFYRSKCQTNEKAKGRLKGFLHDFTRNNVD